MRVIKFRAWDNTPADTGGQVMLSWDKIRELSEHEILLDAILEREHESLIPMQFTGLTDANGVEIYESDIIRWGGSVIGAVSFAYCEFIIGIGNNARAMCALRDGQAEEELEVVGNIHQNPELLESNNV